MKYALPAADGRLIGHFGHAPGFAFVEVDDSNGQIGEWQYMQAPPHQPGVLPRWIAEQGADIVICGGMGGRARALCESAGIDVVHGVAEGHIDEIVRAHIDGSLDTGNDACHHHHHHTG